MITGVEYNDICPVVVSGIPWYDPESSTVRYRGYLYKG